MLKTQTVLVYL